MIYSSVNRLLRMRFPPLLPSRFSHIPWLTSREEGQRHTAATLLLAGRVNPKVVSEMLGHSTVAITLDIYSHVLPDMQQDAAATLEQLLYP